MGFWELGVGPFGEPVASDGLLGLCDVHPAGDALVWLTAGEAQQAIVRFDRGGPTSATLPLTGGRWCLVGANDDGLFATSPSGDVAALSLDGAKVRWRSSTGLGGPACLRGVVHEDGLFVVADGGTVVRLDAVSGHEGWRRPLGSDGFKLVLPGPGRGLAVVTDRTTVQVLGPDGDAPVRFEHSVPVGSVAHSPGGTRIVTASGNRALHVWRADGTLEQTLDVALADPFGAVFSDEDTLRFTVREDRDEPILLRTVRLRPPTRDAQLDHLGGLTNLRPCPEGRVVPVVPYPDADVIYGPAAACP